MILTEVSGLQTINDLVQGRDFFTKKNFFLNTKITVSPIVISFVFIVYSFDYFQHFRGNDIVAWFSYAISIVFVCMFINMVSFVIILIANNIVFENIRYLLKINTFNPNFRIKIILVVINIIASLTILICNDFNAFNILFR